MANRICDIFHKTLISNFHDEILRGDISKDQITVIARQYKRLSTLEEWEEALMEAAFAIRKEITKSQPLPVS